MFFEDERVLGGERARHEVNQKSVRARQTAGGLRVALGFFSVAF
jgi:hypothetical protein